MEKELLEFRKFVVSLKENAEAMRELYIKRNECSYWLSYHTGRSVAFDEFLEEFDLLLKMNIVNQTVKQSPTDDLNQSDVIRPSVKQNPNNEDLVCNTCIKHISHREGFHLKGKCLDCYFEKTKSPCGRSPMDFA